MNVIYLHNIYTKRITSSTSYLNITGRIGDEEHLSALLDNNCDDDGKTNKQSHTNHTHRGSNSDSGRAGSASRVVGVRSGLHGDGSGRLGVNYVHGEGSSLLGSRIGGRVSQVDMSVDSEGIRNDGVDGRLLETGGGHGNDRASAVEGAARDGIREGIVAVSTRIGVVGEGSNKRGGTRDIDGINIDPADDGNRGNIEDLNVEVDIVGLLVEVASANSGVPAAANAASGDETVDSRQDSLQRGSEREVGGERASGAGAQSESERSQGDESAGDSSGVVSQRTGCVGVGSATILQHGVRDIQRQGGEGASISSELDKNFLNAKIAIMDVGLRATLDNGDVASGPLSTARSQLHRVDSVGTRAQLERKLGSGEDIDAVLSHTSREVGESDILDDGVSIRIDG
jgi:hypothetical protein